MSVKFDTPAENIELKTNRLTALDDVQSHDEGYPTGLAAKEYADEACSSKENVANKITEISDEQTYGAEKYPTAEAVKAYVSGHPASPATRMRVTIPKNKLGEITVGTGTGEYQFVSISCTVKIGTFNNGVYTPITTPAIPCWYDAQNDEWYIENTVQFTDGFIDPEFEGVRIRFMFRDIDVQLYKDGTNLNIVFDGKFETETPEEIQPVISQLIDTISGFIFTLDTYIDKTMEFEE